MTKVTNGNRREHFCCKCYALGKSVCTCGHSLYSMPNGNDGK